MLYNKDPVQNLLLADQSYYSAAVRGRGYHYKVERFDLAKACLGSLHPWAWWLLLREFGKILDPDFEHPEIGKIGDAYPSGTSFVPTDDRERDVDLPSGGRCEIGEDQGNSQASLHQFDDGLSISSPGLSFVTPTKDSSQQSQQVPP